MSAVASIALQTEADLGGPWSVLVRQRRDHVRLDRLLHEVESTDGLAREVVLHRIARLVFPHAFAEESVLWPELRRVLPDGDALTLQVEREHQEVNELWALLEDGAAERRQLVARLVAVLRQDVRDEEDVLLPRLQAAVEGPRLRRLGVSWEVVRRAAPTRPHPVVSRRPPGNVLAALPLTALDRARDGLDAIGRGAPSRLTTHARSASEALTRASGRVECLPILRRGEHSDTRPG